jgi:diguanylate cyclase (GGDEF)-like protein/PAS domain S-box-containing protein
MNRTLLEAFQETGSIMLLIEPKSSQIVDANPAAVRFYGYPREHLLGMSLREINTLPWDETALERRQALARNVFQFRHRLISGEERYVDAYFCPVDGDGRPLLLAILHDVTRLKQTQEELRTAETLYRTAFQTSHDAVAISRLQDGLFIDANRSFLEIMEYTQEDVIGRTSRELDMWADPEDRNRLADAVEEQSFCQNFEMKLRKRSGEVFWSLASVSKIEMDGVAYMLSFFKNVSDIKEAQERINTLAFFDPLTNLPNRRALLDRVQESQDQAVADRAHLALLFVDLDDFKIVNDSLGHHVGDTMLKEIALRLAECTRKTDTVARLGGDEFAVILRDLSIESKEAAAQAKTVADKIMASVGEPYLINGHECQCATSIGIAVFGDTDENGSDVLQRAEMAMFQAKEAGHNTIRFFSPALQAAVSARATLEEELRRAIKRSEFVLFYQPQVESSRLTGAEALIRWNHPTRGLLAPGEFIQLAEQSGLIVLLGNLVLETACRQIAAWASRKWIPGIAVAVNISAHQFNHPEFVEQVLGILARTGVDPHSLDLELTESLMVDNIDEVIAKITVLKSHGLRFSLDDFGTGYSSLTYLKRMPLDQLKIDRSFVRDILTDKNSAAIAQTIISLGKAMGMAVIAEGVETEEQKELLISLGCHTFQGYLYARPLPMEEFERSWLAVGVEAR